MRIDKSSPIGVFDSGIGGLTVLKALHARLPAEDLIYFGDTARVPYGPKSKAAVTRYSLEVARFLASQGIKLLVVACNTSSARSLKEIKKKIRIPVLGVIEPGARAAAAATRSGRVGIIATEGTIASGAYVRALKARRKKVRAASAACPLFVPLVEEGLWSHPATTAIARRYLTPLKRLKIDALILGCTHYPLLKGTLRRIMGPGVQLIDSAEETAREAVRCLEAAGSIRAKGRRRGKLRFFVSDSPESFLRVGRRLAGLKIEGVRLHRFD